MEESHQYIQYEIKALTMIYCMFINASYDMRSDPDKSLIFYVEVTHLICTISEYRCLNFGLRIKFFKNHVYKQVL